jgi:hypothetical protein
MRRAFLFLSLMIISRSLFSQTAYSFKLWKAPAGHSRLHFVSINDSGRIAGGYLGPVSAPAAAGKSKSGVIGYGGYVVIATAGTTTCITDTSVLAGVIIREPWRGGQEGFFRFPSGIIGYYIFPGTASGVQSFHVNSKLHKVGFYTPKTNTDIRHGFANLGNGLFNVDFPGATGTFCNDINDSDLIVGDWVDANDVGHGFVWDHGSFTSIDVPFPGSIDTSVTGVSNDGKIVGDWVDSSLNPQGFTLINGAFTKVTVPNSIFTSASDINNQGVVVGSTYINGDSDGSAFVATPVK